MFFLEKDIPEHKIKLLKAQLQKMKQYGEISDFTYISADDALKVFAQKHPEKYSYLKRNSLDGNPLSPSVQIIPKKKNIESLTRLFLTNTYIGVIDQSKINFLKSSLLQSNKAIEFLSLLDIGFFAFVFIIILSVSGLIAAFLSSSFFLRKKEISVMRLVGASHSFIRMPFLAEGVTLVMLALLLAWGVFFMLIEFLISRLVYSFSSPHTIEEMKQNVQEMWNNFLAPLPWWCLAVFFLALITSFVSVELLLRKRNILN